MSSKVEMTKIGIPSWLTNSKVVRQIDEINAEIDKMTLSTATDTKTARQELLDAAMAGTISAAEFVKKSAKIKDPTTQTTVDIQTVKLLKQKKELAPKIRELASESAAVWERKADEQEKTIRGFFSKLSLRKAEEHAVLSTEKTLREYRESASRIKAQGENFWTSSDSELLRAIEQRLRQTLGIFNTSN